MEKGPHLEIPAPPYPGPPLDYNAAISQPGSQPSDYSALQPQVQPQVQPQFQPVVQPVIQTVSHGQIIQPVTQMVVVQNRPKDVPGQMMCPYCQANVVTAIEYKFGAYTWLVCGLLALFMCWPCYFIPFCVKDCQDVVHSCPCCNRVIHVHKRM